MTSSSRHPRLAFTLIEMLVAAVLATMVLGVTFSFLVPAMRASARGTARIDMQQQGVVALSRLANDLEQAGTSSISLNDSAFAATWPSMNNPSPPQSPLVLGIQHLQNVDPNGNQIWDATEEVYVWDPTNNAYPLGPASQVVWAARGGTARATVGNLVLYTCQEPLPGAITIDQPGPTRLTDAQLTGIEASNPPRYSVLASGVQYFVVSMPQPGPSVSQPITLHLSLMRSTANGASTPETFSLERTVSTRNSN